ncbi:DUF547 domain-containing protein [Candidatus Uabimicrobium sp. HlEnr_7]|uniref:DUF547 domain-containing protein n=1 Tax=Candidatus Uabimicrobium helgolandensis TaxID=3095367 RepID=UPI0035579EEA
MKNAILVVLTVVLSCSISADVFDNWNEKYNGLVKDYVKSSTVKGIKGNYVDYKGLRSDKRVNQLRTQLASLPSLSSLPRNKRLACWINYYNFLTLHVVAKNPGLKGLQDLNKPNKNVWNQSVGKVLGSSYTLDHIEHKIIRKYFKEPRIHFALVCAAVSCPNLLNEAYTANKLESQLQSQLRAFALNKKKGINLDKNGRVLRLSSLFDWFKDDFGGNSKKWLQNNKIIPSYALNYKVEYLNYDWDLNALPGKN